MIPTTPSKHAWKFFRAGGFDQVRLSSGADLLNLDKLDQKLWVALACPASGLEFDPRTLALIDTDKDGRVRAPELIAAVKWIGSVLKNLDDLLRGSSELSLSAINDATEEGKQILASAKQILANLGKASATAITLEDTLDTAKIFAQTKFNGDGIVPADSASEDDSKAVISDIIACLGSETDRSGKPGISLAKVDQFFAEAQAYSEWWGRGESDPGILPLGEATAAAAAAVHAVKSKVADYFARCRLAAFDPRATSVLNRDEKEYAALAAKELTLTAPEIAGLPLAHVEISRPLPLGEGVNPAWADAMAKLRLHAVKPLLGDAVAITEADWAALAGKLGPYECWMAGKAGLAVEKLGLERLRNILASKAMAPITVLIAKDKALEPEVTAIAAVERLVRYHRDLYKLCNNFVSFSAFYSRKEKAIFQAGTLYLDQRSCDLCLTVEDGGKHAAMAALAGTFLAYCDCVRKGAGEKMQIVAAFTDGDSDNLMAGRNGIFYDRKGRDWDATITKIIDNPISIRQAFWSPYKKFVRMIEEQIAQRAAAADAESQAKMLVAAKMTADPSKVKPLEAPKKLDVGVIAALGVAFGATGTFLATIFSKFVELSLWQIPLVILGIVLLISTPSMLIAYLKLRKRNLGPILDANGWAVNSKARINVPFGGSLTQIATLPPGAQRDLVDPFAEKKSPWPKLIVLAILLWIAIAALNRMGYLYDWTGGFLGSPRPAKAVEKAKGTAAANDAAVRTPEPAK